MAHLTCTQHGRRVIVLPSEKIIHRNGSGDTCHSLAIRISGRTFYPGNDTTSVAEQLLNEIFTGGETNGRE